MHKTTKLLVLFIALNYYCQSFAAGSDVEMLVNASGDRVDRLEAKVNELYQKLSLVISQNKNLHSQILQLEESTRELSGKMQAIEHHNVTVTTKLQNLTADTNARFETIEKHPKTGNSSTQLTKNPTAVLTKYLAMIEQQKYQSAISGLQKYIDTNPKSPILGEAYYWLGYAYMSKGSFAQAIKLFMKSYNGFPKSGKAEYSLLNMGISLEKLNEHEKACTVLQKLINTTSNKQVQSLAKHEAKNFLCIETNQKPVRPTQPKENRQQDLNDQPSKPQS